MNRLVTFSSFGGPEVLELNEAPEPHPGSGELRVRVAAVSLNPLDWKIINSSDVAQAFNVTPPAGFGHDLAGVVDEVGQDTRGFNVGDRVAGGALGAALADYVVVKAGNIYSIPDALDYATAATIPIAGMTAAAVMDTLKIESGETLLIGGAGGGVGIFLIQLAKLVGAKVIGTCSESTFPFLKDLGAEPISYGLGLTERARKASPHIDAAADLVGTETVYTALELGVDPKRIATIAAGPNPPGGAVPTGGGNAPKASASRIIDAIVTGKLRVPIAARFPMEKIREAVTMQQDGHVHGKILIEL